MRPESPSETTTLATLDIVHASNDAARLAGLLDSATDAIIAVNESHQVVLYNRAAEGVFGWKAADVLGHPLELLLPERFHAVHAEHVKRFGRTGVTSRHMGGSSVSMAGGPAGKTFRWMPRFRSSIRQRASSSR